MNEALKVFVALSLALIVLTFAGIGAAVVFVASALPGCAQEPGRQPAVDCKCPKCEPQAQDRR